MKIIAIAALLFTSSVFAQGQGCMWTDTKATCFAQLSREAKPATCTINVRGYIGDKLVEKTKTVELQPGQVDRVEVEGKGFTGASMKVECK